MGFMSSTFNSCQYLVSGGTVFRRELAPAILEALTTHAFKPIDETADEKSIGWVNLFDPSVTSFTAEPGTAHIDHYIGFSLRVDQRRVPAAVLRERCKLAEEEFLKENPGYTRVPKLKREEIKEAQRAALLAKTLPVPTIYDAVWDLDSGIITFCNLSMRAMDLFHDMFKKTFEGASLRLITPYNRAFAICDRGDMDGKYLTALQAANKSTSDSVLSLMKENEWIGADFLLWLLWLEHDGGFVRPEVTAYIDQKILLAGAGENGPQKIVFSGDQTKMKAVKAALYSGQQITVARIFMEAEEHTWAFTLRGSNFELASYKCPPVMLEKDDTTDALMERQAVFLERIAIINKGRELFERMFREFLIDRLSIEWAAKSADIQNWMKEE